MYYDDLVEKFGDNMAKKIESGMIEKGSFRFDTSDIYADENYDINDSNCYRIRRLEENLYNEYVNGLKSIGIFPQHSYCYLPNSTHASLSFIIPSYDSLIILITSSILSIAINKPSNM